MIKSFIIAASVFFIFFFFVPWKRSVIFCAIWIIFEGALRKWVLPGFHKEIYFIKDIILLTVYIKFFTIKRTSFRGRDYGLSTVKILLISLFLWGLLEACNPELPNIFVGLFGFKQLFFYIPLIFIVPHVFNDKEKLFSYIKRYTFLFVPIAILGIRQFFAEPGSPTTTYLSWDGTTVISVVGEHTRITGTFSYISGYTAYLTMLAFLGLSLFSKGSSLTKHWAILGAYMLVVLNLLMTGARGPVVVVLIGIVIYFIAMFVKRPKVLSRWLVLAILIGVLLVFMGSTFSTAIQNIYGRGMEDIHDRLKYSASALSQGLTILGHGIGLTQQAISFIAPGFEIEDTGRVVAEDEPIRIITELGLVGFLLLYLARFLIIVAALKMHRNLKDGSLQFLSLAIFLFLSLNINGAIVFNHISNFYYWFVVGMLFSLPALEVRKEQGSFI